jgi:four helix bundle protein
MVQRARPGHQNCLDLGVGVRRLEELIAWQLACGFRDELYRLLASSKAAQRDFRYCDQLRDAALSTVANIAEGFHRRTTRQFLQFLTYSRGSHAEAEARLRDGIVREYFREHDCAQALQLAKRCGKALLRLSQSLEPFINR